MTSVEKNKAWWRALFLGGFILSLLGPWAFDLLNVPAQYACEKPAVRLYGDFCGYPLTGFGLLGWLGGGVVDTLDRLLKGTLEARLPELLWLVYGWIVVVPFFTLSLLILKKDAARLRAIHLVACGLACLPALFLVIAQSNRELLVQPLSLLWGIGLYVLAAAGSMLFEVLAARARQG